MGREFNFFDWTEGNEFGASFLWENAEFCENLANNLGSAELLIISSLAHQNWGLYSEW